MHLDSNNNSTASRQHVFEESCSRMSFNPEQTPDRCSEVQWYCTVITQALSKERSEAWLQYAVRTAQVTLTALLRHRCACMCMLPSWLHMYVCICVRELSLQHYRLTAAYRPALVRTSSVCLSLNSMTLSQKHIWGFFFPVFTQYSLSTPLTYCLLRRGSIHQISHVS